MGLLAAVGAGLLFLIIIVLIPLLPSRYVRPSQAPGKCIIPVQVLVLGDIGRSPRMQYHALSIARHGGVVHLIGYQESAVHPDLVSNEHVTIWPLAPPPAGLRSGFIPFSISGPLKVLWQVWTLSRVLGWETPPARWLLVQNPPSIPTLAVALVISAMRRTALMIDWHNYGWTILAGSRGASHPFVGIARAYESVLGWLAPTANITVSHAMTRQLKKGPLAITSPVLTLHDRPASIFQPIRSPLGRSWFLDRLPQTKHLSRSIMAGETKLVVSSTSWTPDEDFSILLDALVSYAGTATRPIVAIITGKGPQKAYYAARIKDLTDSARLPNIRILTAWLSLDDYAQLLSCADLGICLHMSSSGVDLPMKVVDMFGSGLPVAAYSAYESFSELVKEGRNGCGFETADELAEILTRLFSDKGADELLRLRAGAREEGRLRWDEEWDRVLGRVIGVI